MTNPHNANGHRRKQLRDRVLREETHCGICDQPVDKTLTQLHGPGCDGRHLDNRPGCVPNPRGPAVDEIVPRLRGGSPLDRSNVMLTHRECNRLKADHSLEWARATVHGQPTAPTTTITNLLTW